MKKIILSMALLLAVYVTQAQVGIGTASPAASSQLEVTSTTKGFLPPRMTTAQRDAISSPATGLQIYNTDNKAIETFTGTTGEWLTVGQGKGAIATNTAIGVKTLFSNTTGTNNTANGNAALQSNTTGYYNTANGNQALYANTTGNFNTANGNAALALNTIGGENNAYGVNALNFNTTGSKNTAYGNGALTGNTTGSYNTAIGYLANVASGALTNATAIGNGAIVAADNAIQLGNTSVTNVKTSGTITAGAITYPNTGGTTGQVLTTNGSTAAWSAVTATAYSGILPVANGGTGVSTSTGTGNVVLSTSPTLVTPALGTPASGVMTNVTGTATGLTAGTATNIAGGSAGLLPYQSAANTTALLAAGTAGQVLTSGGAAAPTWTTPSSISVPYTGATGAVNLGAYDLTVNGITVGMGAGSVATNTANGYRALFSNTTGTNNTANGYSALSANTTGDANTATGYQALYSNTTGYQNTANGYMALQGNTTGYRNTANGYNALYSNTTGYQNTAIGRGADVASGALTNATAVGYGAIVAADNTIQLGNTSVTNVKTKGNLININPAVVAINTTATATAADIITGYIASTTAAAVNITLPTATDISTALGSSVDQGTSFEFSVENTGGSNSVTLVAGTGITVHAPIISGTDNLIITPTNAIGRFRLVFTSTTSAKIFRIY